jgi:superfamily II DNA or RNA helicase
MVEIKVANCESQITGIPEYISDKIYETLAFMRKGEEYGAKVAAGEWDGVRRLFKRWKGTFPTGLLSMVRKILRDNDVEHIATDLRAKPERNRNWTLKMPFDLRYYQREAVDACKKSQRGVISLPTASGKTVTFSVLIGELTISPTIVYVPNRLLLHQTSEDIAKFLRDIDGKPIKVGKVGDGICKIEDVTVMTIQTAITAFNMVYDRNKGTVKRLTKKEISQAANGPKKKKRRRYEDPDDEDLDFVNENKAAISELIKTARVVICDECHRAASFLYQEILKRSKNAYYRYAFSGTPWREDNTGMLITSSFGRIIYEKTHSELVREGFLSRPYVIMTDVPKSCAPNISMETYRDVVKNCIIDSDARNRLIASIAKQVSPIGPTLMLVQEIQHGKALAKLLPESEFISAKTSKTKQHEAIQNLLSGKLPILIATPVGDEGLNLVELKVLILCHAGRSVGKLKQRVGRTSRIHEGKDYSLVVDFRDKNEYLSSQARDRERAFLAEEEWVIMRTTADGWESLRV